MSIRAINWAFEQQCGGGSTKLVLIKLADNANDDGACWPSHRYIEQHCELSRATIKRVIQKLTDLGLLKVEHRFQDGVQLPNVYHLNILASDGLPVNRVGSPRAGGGFTVSPGVGSPRATEPSIETIIKPKSQSDGNKLPIKSTELQSEQVSKNKPQPRQKCDALKYMDRIIEKNRDITPIASILDMAGLCPGNGN